MFLLVTLKDLILKCSINEGEGEGDEENIKSINIFLDK